MDIDDYQKLCLRTAGLQNSDEAKKAWALGIGGEAGEILELIKKEFYHGKAMQKSKLVNELGDLLWYIAAMSHEYDIPMSQLLNANLEKLKLRYPEGFSFKNSANRADEKGWENH
jgi:NTP pyrophosphatase (non-canonical NTP hydrolase)